MNFAETAVTFRLLVRAAGDLAGEELMVFVRRRVLFAILSSFSEFSFLTPSSFVSTLVSVAARAGDFALSSFGFAEDRAGDFGF